MAILAALSSTRLEEGVNVLALRLCGNESMLLPALRGLKNGLTYGAKVRAPHAFVMTMLFGKGSLVQRLREILLLTVRHAVNLGRFVFGYQMAKALLGFPSSLNPPAEEERERSLKSHGGWRALLSAALVGFFIFGEEGGVNTQINLYLLSRVIHALMKLFFDSEIGTLLRIPGNFPTFRLFAAAVWGVGLWLFETHPHTLQRSLRASMEYLYNNNNLPNGASPSGAATTVNNGGTSHGR